MRRTQKSSLSLTGKGFSLQKIIQTGSVCDKISCRPTDQGSTKVYAICFCLPSPPARALTPRRMIRGGEMDLFRAFYVCVCYAAALFSSIIDRGNSSNNNYYSLLFSNN